MQPLSAQAVCTLFETVVQVPDAVALRSCIQSTVQKYVITGIHGEGAVLQPGTNALLNGWVIESPLLLQPGNLHPQKMDQVPLRLH